MVFGEKGKGRQAEPLAYFYAVAMLRACSLFQLFLEALPASQKDLIHCLRDSYFARVGLGITETMGIMEMYGVIR